MECNYSFLQRYRVFYDQHKEQENVFLNLDIFCIIDFKILNF